MDTSCHSKHGHLIVQLCLLLCLLCLLQLHKAATHKKQNTDAHLCTYMYVPGTYHNMPLQAPADSSSGCSSTQHRAARCRAHSASLVHHARQQWSTTAVNNLLCWHAADRAQLVKKKEEQRKAAAARAVHPARQVSAGPPGNTHCQHFSSIPLLGTSRLYPASLQTLPSALYSPSHTHPHPNKHPEKGCLPTQTRSTPRHCAAHTPCLLCTRCQPCTHHAS